MNDHKELLTEFIVDNFLFGDRDKLKMDTPLFEKGIIDSTGVLELVAFIEENFKVTVTDEELVQDNFSSINSIDSFLKSKNKRASS
jgi:acyl carrier protein